MYQYNFPRTRFVGTNSINDQIKHLASEIEELKQADSWEEKLLETLDVIHSAETLLRRFERNWPGCVEHGMLDVLAKNHKRGYYRREAEKNV